MECNTDTDPPPSPRLCCLAERAETPWTWGAWICPMLWRSAICSSAASSWTARTDATCCTDTARAFSRAVCGRYSQRVFMEIEIHVRENLRLFHTPGDYDCWPYMADLLFRCLLLWNGWSWFNLTSRVLTLVVVALSWLVIANFDYFVSRHNFLSCFKVNTCLRCQLRN